MVAHRIAEGPEKLLKTDFIGTMPDTRLRNCSDEKTTPGTIAATEL